MAQTYPVHRRVPMFLRANLALHLLYQPQPLAGLRNRVLIHETNQLSNI